MSAWLARTPPGLKKVAGQLTFMSLGSGLFFLIKIVWLYLTVKAGMAAWLSYLIINVVLTVIGAAYHSKVTFKTGLSIPTFWKYVQASAGLKLFDYFGFVALTYVGHLYPVLSVVIMSAIQVGARYLIYAAYVFRERAEPPPERTFRWSIVILGVALLAGCINYALAINGAPPQKDGRQNYCAAADLYAFGVLGGDCGDQERGADATVEPSMKREPGLPALLALTFALADQGQDVRVCADAGPQWCETLRIHQRMIMLVPFLALIVLVFLAGNDVTGNTNLAAAAALCAAFGTGLVESSLAFLAEPPAAVLFLIVAWMMYRIVNRPRPLIAGIVCGLALGLLALTKAIYFYFIPVLGLIALAALPFRSWRASASSTLAAVVIAALISGAWVYRNHERFGTTAIASRDGNVMAIRAQFTTMTWRQYWAGYFAFTPKLGPKLAPLLGVDPDDVAMFDRDNPAGFLQRYRRGEGPVSLPKGSDQREMRRQALVAFVENWPMEVALIPLTIYRSAFLPIGYTSRYAGLDAGPLRIVRMSLAAVLGTAMIFALLLNFIVDLWRSNIPRLAFHLPAIYSVGIHSVMTHYIPRYNLPLFGVLAIELCIAAVLVWATLVGTSARK